jgi:Zn finger protein HypA/HybF involved in hydrogenase expression
MKCPCCEQSFPLTWERYIEAPSGRHLCPNCGKNARVKFSLLYSAILLVVGGICAAPGAIILHQWFGGYWPILGVIPSILVMFPMDKMFDNRFRKLKAIEPLDAPGTATCLECNGVFSLESMIAHNGVHVCARCKPIFLQRLAEGAKTRSAP